MRFTLALILGLALAGCSATPAVSYHPVSVPDASGKLKFVLPHSLIIVSRKDVKDEGAKLIATSVPTEAPLDGKPLQVYEIAADSRFGIETRLNITYIDNSRIISSLGVTVEDNRAKTIGEIAGVITTVVAAAAKLADGRPGPDMPQRLPVVVDPRAYEQRPDKKIKWLPLPRNEDVGQEPDATWVYRLDIEPVPVDAVETSTFFEKHAQGTDVMPFAACHDATLYILKSPKKAADADRDKLLKDAWSFGLKLANPDRVLTVKLPVKGKVDMHTACGANVTSDKTETASPWAILGEVVKQATAIKKAYDDEKKQGQKKPSP